MKLDISLADFAANIAEKFKNSPLKVQDSMLRAERKKLTGQRDKITAELQALSAKMGIECPAFLNPDRVTRDEAPPFVQGADFPPKEYDLKQAVDSLLRLHFADHRRKFLSGQLSELQKQKDVFDVRLVEIDRELAVVRGRLLEG